MYFQKSLGDVIFINTTEIKCPDSYRAQSYPIPLNSQSAVKIEICNILKDNIIEHSNSPFVNPLIIVTKKIKRAENMSRYATNKCFSYPLLRM